jgi:branched-chain amino acid transport system substrate-binding protein
MKKTKILVTAMVVLSVVFLSCQKKQDEIKIGAVLPLTGSMAPYALSIRQGMDIAIDEINATDGINRQQLRIIYEDSQGDSRIGISAFNKLHMIDRVPLVFGSLTGVILAIRPEVDRNNVVLINSSAISPLINEAAEDFLFNFVVNGESEAIFMAKKFQERFPNERLAIFCANTPANIYIANSLEQHLTALEHTNHLREYYETNATDFRVHLDRIRRSGARYGYLLAFSNKEFADILRQTRELNLDIQWFATSAVESRETMELAGEAANGVIYSYPKIVNDTLHAKFQAKFNERHGSSADMLTLTSYDAVHLITEVMRRYGTTGVYIQKGLRSINDFYGIFGQYKLSDTGKQFVDRELLWKVIENGEFRIMED